MCTIGGHVNILGCDSAFTILIVSFHGMLPGRFTCHPSIMHGGGWVLPMAYLLNNDLIRGYGCDSVRAASEYFSKSCAPGAMSPVFTYGQDRLNLCHLCKGTLTNFCARDHTEPYYGFTGKSPTEERKEEREECRSNIMT